MRKGFDGLSGIVKSLMAMNTLNGVVLTRTAPELIFA